MSKRAKPQSEKFDQYHPGDHKYASDYPWECNWMFMKSKISKVIKSDGSKYLSGDYKGSECGRADQRSWYLIR